MTVPSVPKTDAPPHHALAAAVLYRALRQALLEGAPSFDAPVRRDIEGMAYEIATSQTPLRGKVPPETAALIEKIVRHAYKVTDQDIGALLAAGRSEGEVLDLVLCAATGAGRARLEAGLRALRRTSP